MLNGAIEIPVKGRASVNSEPDQFKPDSERNPQWYFDCVSHYLSYYNTSPQSLNIPFIKDPIQKVDTADWGNPVTHMVRMMQYYLGQQPNMDYSFVTDDIKRDTMQAMWIRNHNVKEFVDYFRGIVLGKLGKAKWTARPMSERAETERTAMMDKLMLAQDLKPILDAFKEQYGVEYSPANGIKLDLPDSVEKYMDTDWKEFFAEELTSLAEGIWFEGAWLHKMTQAFMHLVMTSNCGLEHFMKNGRPVQEVVMPYQLVIDNRFDNDYGYQDSFIGRVGSATIAEIKSMFPSFTMEQIREMQVMANDHKAVNDLNSMTRNMTWWSVGQNQRNTVSYVRMYWRTKRLMGKKEAELKAGNRIVRTSPTDPDSYIVDDVATATIVGNKWIVNYGYIDNLVEEFGDVSRPTMPIIRFRPNTFLGTSVSEVSRIHKIVDEIDYLDYKIREMVGKAKGKVYVLYGDRFSDGNTPKEFLEEIESMGITVKVPSGEDDDRRDHGVDMIDWTLDPSVDKLWMLIKEKEDRMKKIMSASDISMGQQQTYYGFNTMQSMINQNSIGTAYMIDGFMEWVVLNMRYAANMYKNVLAMDGGKDMRIMVGDRGVKFFKINKDLLFEQVFVQLNINDAMDSQQKDRILSIALANAQNDKIDMHEYLKIEQARSVSEAINMLESVMKKKKAEQTQMQQAQMQNQDELMNQQKQYEAIIEEYKQESANYRAELSALSKNITEMMKFMQVSPDIQPPSITERFAQMQQAQQQGVAQQQ